MSDPSYTPSALALWALGFLRPYRTALSGLAALSLAEVLLRAAQPWALKAVVDYSLIGVAVPAWMARLLGPEMSGDRFELLMLFVMLGGLVQVGHHEVLLLHGRIQAETAMRVVHRLRQELFGHVQCLALAHHTRTPTGQTVYHLEADAACLEQLLFKGLYPIGFSALTLIVMFGILARVDPLLALVACLVIPGLYVAVRAHTRRLGGLVDQVKAIESEMSGHLHESLSGVALVKSLAREQHEVTRYSERASRAIDAKLALTIAETRFAFTIGLVTTLGTALTLGLGGYQVLRGELSLGTLLVVLAYMGFVYGPMSVIANTAATLEAAFVSARRVRQTLDLPPEPDAGVRPGPPTGDVRFDRVTFSYGREPVLVDVTVHVRPGETIALVGPSGAGKTTMVMLLNRFLEASSGTVSIDGVDVRRYARIDLRETVAIVLQQAILISGTIAENIRYGRLTATDAEVEEAARAAHAHEFIERLPGGYATQMDNAGAALSGGQRQRLSIARAFLRDAPVLILDEPTAALDTLTERQVFDALSRLRRGRTTFVIAHRLSTVRNADRILVLDNGCVVGEGTHATLMESSPLYRDLCRQMADNQPRTP